MRIRKMLFASCVALVLLVLLILPANAKEAAFKYKLYLTDQTGASVTNPRSLKAGDTLNVEIELRREDNPSPSYYIYGLEMRLFSRGLKYNQDGVSFRSEAEIRELEYITGRSVGFAYYDMQRVGIAISNPVRVCKWSYTVTNPAAINITVPVAVMYVPEKEEAIEPVGNAILYLDPDGGEITGEDVSGEYNSGTILKLPAAKLADYEFLGWSDGEKIYPAGADYIVSGVVTLTAQWEGLERNRAVSFDAKGGRLVREDPSGNYADGEKIILPNAEREGYKLQCWTDGNADYYPGDEYVVDNTKSFAAVWEPIESEPTSHASEPVPTGDKGKTDDGGTSCWLWWLLGALAAGLLGWWLFLLWKRRWVLYSLKTGDVALSYKNKDHDYEVEVVLRTEDEDGNRVKYSLNKSGTVEKDKKLRFIHGQPELYPIVEIEPGKYRGYLLVTGGEGEPEEQNVRIKVLDRELRERKNDE